ncbi:hypothetical protein SAMN06297129_3755 [Pseudooceanicola antarcticus]|nr:hypothetical protein SAMN06297129_3755 [Pseudooceanicola antarcticus]
MNGADPDGGLNGRMRTAASNARLANGNTESEKKKRERTAALMRSVAAIEAQLAKLYERRDQLMSEIDQLEQEIEKLDQELDHLDDAIARLEKGEELGLDENGALKDKQLETALQEYERRTGKKVDRSDSDALLQALRDIEANKSNDRDAKQAELDGKRADLDDVRREIDGLEAQLEAVQGNQNQLSGAEEQSHAYDLGGNQWGARQHEAEIVNQIAELGDTGAESAEVSQRSNEYRDEDVIPDHMDIEEFQSKRENLQNYPDSLRADMELALIQQYPEVAEFVAKMEPEVAELIELANAEAEPPATVAEASPNEEVPTQTASADGGWSISGGMG